MIFSLDVLLSRIVQMACFLSLVLDLGQLSAHLESEGMNHTSSLCLHSKVGKRNIRGLVPLMPMFP